MMKQNYTDLCLDIDNFYQKVLNINIEDKRIELTNLKKTFSIANDCSEWLHLGNRQHIRNSVGLTFN